MEWFSNLKINTKFNLIMSILLVLLFFVAAYLTYSRQQKLILNVAVDNARVLAKQIIETREYMSSVVRGEPEQNYSLVPQVVATQVARRITRDSKFYVRQVSLRYRNPENRPDSFESVQLNAFARRTGNETYGIVPYDGKKVFRYMQTMVADKSCLQCHGSYETAPRFVQQRFPKGHFSYNYHQGEVIGAVSVSIPMADLYHQIGVNLALDITGRAFIFLSVILVLGYLVRKTIINPIETVSKTISHVTQTGDFTERIPRYTRDEIGQLINAFNEMMEELGHKTLQHTESEERYRKFIEMARSAVVTFLADGKIVISNERAEKLFDMPKRDLLGESIFHFLEDGELIRESISQYLREGAGGVVDKTSRQKIRDRQGKQIEVEIALSASMTDHKPMFTAIIRDLGRDTH
ncbi:DUF3365 domain-containing protein [Geobacter sp. DSM 9736]|uniref:c-type heme family protein n=1 Tax=Geobacter sp. DSM 9736 TaxID=1277350 RepID=UPI000B505FD1|nr:DUF3365 domain-containing protein [Geobacter sp. DSM 9736]SNB47553.1 PAS domain S-box-containing protein [Geobacter sp. DSM 9736]